MFVQVMPNRKGHHVLPEFVRLLGLRGRQLRIRVLSGVVVRGSTVRIFLPLDNAAEEVATIPMIGKVISCCTSS